MGRTSCCASTALIAACRALRFSLPLSEDSSSSRRSTEKSESSSPPACVMPGCRDSDRPAASSRALVYTLTGRTPGSRPAFEITAIGPHLFGQNVSAYRKDKLAPCLPGT